MNHLCQILLDTVPQGWNVYTIARVNLALNLEYLFIISGDEETLKLAKDLTDEYLLNFTSLVELSSESSDITGRCFANFSDTFKKIRCDECRDVTDEYLSNLTSLISLSCKSTSCFSSFSDTLKKLRCDECNNVNQNHLKNQGIVGCDDTISHFR